MFGNSTRTTFGAVFGVLITLGLYGPGCLFESNGLDGSFDRAWMSIAPIQCGGNAWQKEDKSIEDYLADRGAQVLDLRSHTFADVVCHACSCPTGERVDVLVDEEDVDILLAEGFHRFEDWPH